MNGETTGATASTAAKMGLLGPLHFSLGLPFGFFTQALPVMLRKPGFSLGPLAVESCATWQRLQASDPRLQDCLIWSLRGLEPEAQATLSGFGSAEFRR